MESPSNLSLSHEEIGVALGMLYELQSNYLEVILIPAREQKHSGHKVRAVQYANAPWFSKFCSQYTSCRGIGRKRMRRPRTFIKRGHTERALESLIKTGEAKTLYAERLVEFIRLEEANKLYKEARAAAYTGEYEAAGEWLRF